jgi:hypothetical protein
VVEVSDRGRVSAHARPRQIEIDGMDRKRRAILFRSGALGQVNRELALVEPDPRPLPAGIGHDPRESLAQRGPGLERREELGWQRGQEIGCQLTGVEHCAVV